MAKDAADISAEISQEVLDRWHSHWGALRQKIRDEPQSEYRWIWQLRLQLIEYLLARHSPAVNGQPVLCNPATPIGQEMAASEASAAYDPLHVVGVPTVPPTSAGRPPAAREQIRSRLHDLHDANRDRAAMIEQERQRAVAEFEASHQQELAEMRYLLFHALAQQQPSPPWPLSQPPPPPPASSPLTRALSVPAWPVPDFAQTEAASLLTLSDQQLQNIASEAMSEEQVLVVLRQNAPKPDAEAQSARERPADMPETD